MLDDNNNNNRKSLGKGLEALLGDKDFLLDDITSALDIEDKSSVQKISIDMLAASPFQPRMNFDEESLEALSLSIKEKGILQPLCKYQRW